MAVFDDPLRRDHQMTLAERFWHINWGLLLVIAAIAGLGFAMLYSAAGGDWDPWAKRQAIRFGGAFGLFFLCAMIDIRFWFRCAYLIYVGAFLLLVAVELFGSVGMGAQRWIDLKVMQLQPSEVMKVALVLVLARYFHGLQVTEVRRIGPLIWPILLVLAPVALVLKQPDLGTAAMLAMAAGAMFMIAGVRWWKFALVGAAAAAAVPVIWNFLRSYQKERVLTFLNPERDPLGAGYHIMQSQIALGSGGVTGKGFLAGTQSHLTFLPEKQTDFIFTMLAEEFGMVGGLILLGLYFIIFVYGFAIAFRARNHFGRLLAAGLTVNLFLYVFINIAMVMGLLPVVGVPLPLISYGGTAMLTVMISLGIIASVSVHKDVRIPRRGPSDGW